MALTLNAIVVNLSIGLGVMALSLFLFAVAVYSERINDIIAPRTWARSTKVIKNVLGTWYGFSWFTWATQLSYHDMLEGIPGTGTRNDGKNGNLLRCNLDGLVLVRMQALCFKIAMLAAFGCMVVILPMNLSVRCNPRQLRNETCNQLNNLTDFQQTTLANIPSLETVETETHITSEIVARLYATVIFAYILYTYTAVLLWREWVDLLALRRVFFFEYDHWEDRRDEKKYLDSLPDELDERCQHRPSFIPHPELRDTLPNISLWSVLYRLPDDLVQQDNVVNKDWQLYLTTQFFDQCIPNQPGFTSSVAAVTILPSAKELGIAWRKWYIASMRLRRLRYIRQRLAKKLARNQCAEPAPTPAPTSFSSAVGSSTSSDGANSNSVSENQESADRTTDQNTTRKTGIRRHVGERDAADNVTSEMNRKNSRHPNTTKATKQTSSDNNDRNRQTLSEFFNSRKKVTERDDSRATSGKPINPRPSPRKHDETEMSAILEELNEDETDRSTSPPATSQSCRLGASHSPLPTTKRSAVLPIDEDATCPLSLEQQHVVSSDSSESKKPHRSLDDIEKGFNQAMSEARQSATETKSARHISDSSFDAPDCTSDDGRSGRRQSATKPVVDRVPDTLDQPNGTPEEAKLVEPLLATGADTAEDSANYTNTGSDDNPTLFQRDDSQQTSTYLLSDSNGERAAAGGNLKASLTLQDVFSSNYSSREDNNDFNGDETFYRMYSMNDRERREYAARIGFDDDEFFDEFLGSYGPEQLSMFALEYARSAGGCCTRGCCEELVRFADMDDLIEMEESAESSLQTANERLVAARSRVHAATLDVPLERMHAERHREDKALKLLHRNSMADLSMGIESSRSSRMQLSGLRQRHANVEDHWTRAQVIASETENARRKTPRTPRQFRFLDTGKLRIPFTRSWKSRFKTLNEHVLTRAASTSREIVDYAIGTNTFAVVTFTSRQAAIAARQCIVDGNALHHWRQVEDIPVPPLADAAPYNFWHGRNFCRPVTLTINERQKFTRRAVAYVLLFLMYFLYTIPLTAASSLLSTENLSELFPRLSSFQDSSQISTISGFLTGVLYSLFFSICPQIFRAIANYSSNATSVRAAEYVALRYYWYFMLLTSFTGTSLANMVIEGIGVDLRIGAEFQRVLRNVAAIIPTQVSATWLNWMIVRFSQTFPLFYMLQVSTLLATTCRIKWLARVLRAGGAGAPVPYRIYVDTGIVFLCVIALAPVSPLVAPIAFAYTVISSPMIRWLVIFVYRPDHDSGGQRWPLIFQIFISGMILAQIFLTTMMLLKRAYGPAILAAFSLIPTYWFNMTALDRFYRSFRDAGLLQTSQLDGWGSSSLDSVEKREEYRRWLVDCHKASYVPICLAGPDNLLTAEPAVVIPSPDDAVACRGPERNRSGSIDSMSLSHGATSQRGAIFTRVRNRSDSTAQSFM